LAKRVEKNKILATETQAGVVVTLAVAAEIQTNSR
jgi:hypothetical protein